MAIQAFQDLNHRLQNGYANSSGSESQDVFYKLLYKFVRV